MINYTNENHSLNILENKLSKESSKLKHLMIQNELLKNFSHVHKNKKVEYERLQVQINRSISHINMLNNEINKQKFM